MWMLHVTVPKETGHKTIIEYFTSLYKAEIAFKKHYDEYHKTDILVGNGLSVMFDRSSRIIINFKEPVTEFNGCIYKVSVNKS